MKKINNLTLKGFRGYRNRPDGAPFCFDLDADLILITGKNGVGKSTLLAALDLLLHGTTARLGKMGSLLSNGSSEGHLACEFEGDENEQGRKTLALKQNEPILLSEWGEQRSSASIFYQDDSNLDTEQLYRLLSPDGQIVQQVQKAIKEGQEALRKLRQDFLPLRINVDDKRQTQVRALAPKLARLGELAFPWAKSFTQAKLLIRADNLANHWASQLDNLVTAIDRSLDQPLGGSKLFERTLDALATGLDTLAERLQRELESSTRPTQQFALLGALPADARGMWVTSADMLDSTLAAGHYPLPGNTESTAVIQQRRATLTRELGKAQADADSLAAGISKLARGENSLLELLSALGETIPCILADSKLCQAAPAHVLAWTQRLAGEIPTQVEELQGWATDCDVHHDSIRAAVRRLENELFLLDRGRGLAEVLGLEFQGFDDGQPFSFAALRERLANTQDGDGRERAAQEAIDLLAEAARQARNWAEAEREIAQQERSLQDAGNYKAGLLIFDTAEKIIKREQGKDGLSSLMRLLPADKLNEITTHLNTLLVRFHFPHQLLPIKVIDMRAPRAREPKWELVAHANGTPLSFASLSTGQRTQLAMCDLIAVNFALRAQMGHRLMAFDDFTTALDMGQLIPAATLLRQLAYGSNPEFSRQVIVTSHHEDLTNKLLDHLLPPPGRRMKVIEFTDWNPESGPVWNTYEARMPRRSWPTSADVESWLSTHIQAQH